MVSIPQTRCTQGPPERQVVPPPGEGAAQSLPGMQAHVCGAKSPGPCRQPAHPEPTSGAHGAGRWGPQLQCATHPHVRPPGSAEGRAAIGQQRSWKDPMHPPAQTKGASDLWQ